MKLITHKEKHYIQNEDGYREVLATTDSSLKIESELNAYYRNGIGGAKSLPQPSQDFIKYYIEEYNKGNIITSVEVEYEIPQSGDIFSDAIMRGLGKSEPELIYNLVINPDNTVNIKFHVEDNWNEVMEEMPYNIRFTVEQKEWLQENFNPPIRKI